jgi:hypothetical protein
VPSQNLIRCAAIAAATAFTTACNSGKPAETDSSIVRPLLSEPSGSNASASADATNPTFGADSTLAAATDPTFDVTATVGFETGLAQLARLDDMQPGTKDDISVDWGDGTLTGARLANCGPLTCEVWGTHLYTGTGTYNVEISYKRIGDGVRKTLKTHAKVAPVSDFVVLAIGDSYSSGEGVPRNYIQMDNAHRDALWDEPKANYLQDPENASRENVYRGNGNRTYGKDEDDNLVVETCHRSAKSGPSIAARRIKADGNAITFVHMSCSGAKTVWGTGNDGSGVQIRNTGNINDQLDWARTRLPRIDALLMSAGGNDAGFGDTIKDCIDRDCTSDGKDIAKGISNLRDPEDGRYANLSRDINCRTQYIDHLGDLCVATQWSPDSPLSPYSGPLVMADRSYRSQDGKKIDTRDAKLTVSESGCYKFVVDTKVAPPTIETLVVAGPHTCRIDDQGYDNSAPFGREVFLRGSFNDWADPPPPEHAFVNMGDGTLQAELELAAGEYRFKVASGELELLVPAVTLLNRYGNITRRPDGESKPTGNQAAICSPHDPEVKESKIVPDEWQFLQEHLVFPLNDAINDASSRYGWFPVQVPEFRFHGYCVDDRWIVRVGESEFRQGDPHGGFHPNEDGHQYYGDRIYQELVKANPPRTTATATAGGRPYEFGTIVGEDVEVTLKARNPIAAAGVGDIYYSVGTPVCAADSRSQGACKQYGSPFTISTSGRHAVGFFSVNAAGSPERRVRPVSVVIDKDPPEMTCEPDPVTLWPPNGKMVTVRVNVTAVDAIFGPVDFKLTAIGGSEGQVDEDVADFEIGAPDVEGLMRSRRLGDGDGRVYTLTYESMDGVGNVATCEARVTVPHDQGR